MKTYNSFRFSNGHRLYTRKATTRAKALKAHRRSLRKRGVAKAIRNNVRVMYAHMIAGLHKAFK